MVDNLRVHRAKRVQARLTGKAYLIELHYLPSYSPEANLHELLNRDLKTELQVLRLAVPSAIVVFRVLDSR